MHMKLNKERQGDIIFHKVMHMEIFWIRGLSSCVVWKTFSVLHSQTAPVVAADVCVVCYSGSNMSRWIREITIPIETKKLCYSLGLKFNSGTCKTGKLCSEAVSSESERQVRGRQARRAKIEFQRINTIAQKDKNKGVYWWCGWF